MIKAFNIPPDVDMVSIDGGFVYYDLKQLMSFLGLTYYGIKNMKKYKLRVIYRKIDPKKYGPMSCFVLEDDIKNIIYRHRKLVDKYVTGI